MTRVALLFALIACGTAPPPPSPVVVLVSMDTTRADALGCYGRADAGTPTLDALANGGLRFEMALSSSPTTLAAHTTLMSGEDAHGHGVVRNGFPVRADLPLLAQSFGAAGWDRAAVVGSFALEAEMGLDRGFRTYADRGWLGRFGQYETPADTVTDAALAAVDARQPGAPLFLFVHYYDAHMPWDSAPADVQARFLDPTYAGPVGGDLDGVTALTRATIHGDLTPADRAHALGLYQAEVSWVDGQLGRLLQGLDERGLGNDLLVVVTADHGEVFDEIPERPWRHGPDVDLPAIRVPLLMRGTGRFALPAGQTIQRQVRLQDVGATLLQLAGLGSDLGEGADLSPLWSGAEAAPAPSAFAEATRPHGRLRTDGWPNLDLERAIAVDGHLLTRAPWQDNATTLFALTPAQPTVDDATRAAHMTALLAAWDARAPGHRSAEMDDTTASALRALGYLDD